MLKRKLFLTLLCYLVTIVVFAQTKRVEGVVFDETGEPLIGAAVIVKGNVQIGVVTDADGKFVLPNVPQSATKLVVSYLGLTTQEVNANGKIKVIMTSDQTLLQETVVVAFGEQKRSAFTGSAAVLDSKKIEQKQVTNVLSALQGEASGVQMVNNSGDPNATPTLRIRGFSSISAGADPLIIVDGAPYDGGWNNLNPADVANITVLKDAASAALYGARGANGIVLITTKKANAGDAVITLDAKMGAVNRIKRDYETIDNVGQYYETYYKALYNYGINNQKMTDYAAHVYANNTLGLPSNEGGLGYLSMSVPSGQYLIGENGRLNPDAYIGAYTTYKGTDYYIRPDNWMNEATGTGMRQEYNINANGGTDKTQFYASLGYLKSEGICHATGFERFSIRLKSDYQARKWLRLGGNLNYVRSSSRYSSSSDNNIFYFVQHIAPIYPVYLRDAQGRIMTDEIGKLYDYGDGQVNGLDRPYQPQYNPLQDVDLNTSKGREQQFSVAGNANITPLEGLKIILNGTGTVQSRRFGSTSNPFYGYSSSVYPIGYVYQGSDETFSTNFQELINYKRSLDKHNFEVLFGHENYQMNYDYVWGCKKGMATYFENQTLAGAIINSDTDSDRQDYNSEGYFLRAQYDYDEKYFGSFSVRRDASSRFHPDHRWGTFYSLGGAWILSKEQWLSDVEWLNTLKLKASFGQVGNDNIKDFLYKDTYKIVNSDGHVGLILDHLGNKEITWETLNNLNIGFEFEMFKSRLRGNVEYFDKKTTDMLCFVAAPKSMGYGGKYYNIGDMLNRGAEIELSGDVIRNSYLTWSLSANATCYKNEILKIAAKLRTKNEGGYAGYSSGSYYYGEGLPLYTWYMPQYAGVDEEGRSTWYYNKADGTRGITNSYSDADSYVCDDPNPWLYGGFGTSLQFAGFDFSVNFAYSLGGKAYDYGYSDLMSNPTQSNTGSAIHKDILKAWSEENSGSNIPRWQYNDLNTSAFSDRFLQDASWLSLSNINLGYTVPKRLLRPMGISSLRAYVTAENVYYWTSRKGFDPRSSFTGETTTSTYSPSRTISGGFTVSF